MSRRRLTQEEALGGVEKIHPTIDFSRFVYTKSEAKVDVSCKTCGYEWSPTYGNLQRGCGCRKCSGKMKLTHEEALERVVEIHPTIDFSSFVYTKSEAKVDVSCKTCGYEWSPVYNTLKQGYGCLKCGGNMKLTQEEALERVQEIHPTIDFSRFVYASARGKVDVSCKTCGHEWSPVCHSLQQGSGCPRCKSSKGEKRVAEILDERGIAYETEHTVAGRLRLDFYIPSLGIGIEVQGGQHYFSTEFFGGMKTFKRQVKRDRRKRKWCRENGVKLISIPYLEGNTDNFERYLRGIHPMIQPSMSPTSAPVPDDQPGSSTETATESSEQLALPLTDGERAASWKSLNKLHRGNRFRLMFGQPLLDEGRKSLTEIAKERDWEPLPESIVRAHLSNTIPSVRVVEEED
jgi:predicted Zn-ribbon and HTH transcriptional regulator